MKLFKLAALLCLAVAPAFAQTSGPFAITSTQCATIGVSPFTAVVGIQVTGTWTGTLQPEGSIQGQTPFNVLATPSTSQTAQSTITGNGGFMVLVAGYSQFLLCGNSVASGKANVYLNASTAPAGGGAGASSTSPGGASGTLQGNNGGSFGGVPGSTADFTNGTIALAPTGSGIALAVAAAAGGGVAVTVTGDTLSSDIFELFVNGGGSPVVKFDASGNMTTTAPAGILSGTIRTTTHFVTGQCAANGTAANPSVAACGANSGGNFSCDPTASGGTCQVNTTQVDASSVIMIVPTTKTPGAGACNTTPDAFSPTAAFRVASINAGVSFTINLGTFTTTKECFNYFLVN